MLSKPKDKRVAILLALAGVIVPGLHKFYLRQPFWGVLYLVMGFTPIPKIASAIEGIWYILQGDEAFNRNFNPDLAFHASPSANAVDPAQIGAIADALRQLDNLRQDGLVSEYEFEQKRRQLLDRIG